MIITFVQGDMVQLVHRWKTITGFTYTHLLVVASSHCWGLYANIRDIGIIQTSCSMTTSTNFNTSQLNAVVYV